ncbi:putative ribosome biogenesis protein RLP24 [Capsicum baccatum]|uniref:Ribosome biogenesis protein RLP24 n=1 Tax=Capsicum baccatum TaxID=33114 RepID=A0A2G2VWJ9_CAPBA|nr:putative ribosome biogenesis protein RLP24 [Capsicum baccatum]
MLGEPHDPSVWKERCGANTKKRFMGTPKKGDREHGTGFPSIKQSLPIHSMAIDRRQLKLNRLGRNLDDRIFRFCRPKCHKIFKMKRNPRKVKWTIAYKRLHGKDMTQDSTFEFERKCNRPERYDRNVTENTLKAIKKIDKIRVDREERHFAKRMKGKKVKEQREAEGARVEHSLSRSSCWVHSNERV